MKFIKIMACLLAIISLLTVLTACNVGQTGGETTPSAPADTRPRHKANVNVIFTDVEGNQVYATEEGEPYEYDSAYSEPYIFNFLEDFAFMESKKFEYDVSKVTKKEDGKETVTYTLESISVKVKKDKWNTYAADEPVTLEVNGVEQVEYTYWICFVNGEDVDKMNEKLLKDGDTVEFRLTYKGQVIED